MRCLMVEEANHLQNNLAAEKIRRGGDLRVEAEERRTSLRLREEQDAAYRASLEADQLSTGEPETGRGGAVREGSC
ncbi:hypothetical protein F2Q69_00030537 [Brassica cretica]|uniref:Uncharacterized protein n=1 Tax=Brassica cretica TaxID=69181 RepID=A0A8S9S082_BRACR|nr:hypothetical protein F2Q69_00030537 [Brassica cretica]